MSTERRKKTVIFAIMAMAALTTQACQGASGPNVVHTRAANEFSCPKETVKVEELGGTSYRATGCGQTATYTCMGGNFGNPYDAICNKEGGGATTSTTSAKP